MNRRNALELGLIGLRNMKLLYPTMTEIWPKVEAVFGEILAEPKIDIDPSMLAEYITKGLFLPSTLPAVLDTYTVERLTDLIRDLQNVSRRAAYGYAAMGLRKMCDANSNGTMTDKSADFIQQCDDAHAVMISLKRAEQR